jgi:hypothetical protein
MYSMRQNEIRKLRRSFKVYEYVAQIQLFVFGKVLSVYLKQCTVRNYDLIASRLMPFKYPLWGNKARPLKFSRLQQQTAVPSLLW